MEFSFSDANHPRPELDGGELAFADQLVDVPAPAIQDGRNALRAKKIFHAAPESSLSSRRNAMRDGKGRRGNLNELREFGLRRIWLITGFFDEKIRYGMKLLGRDIERFRSS